MGKYFNPGNQGFQEVLNSRYIDKTGMIALINKGINTKQKHTCISRPRRFGKSFAAQMLCAYYDCSCDSHKLFHGLTIEKDSSFEKHLNKYNVVSIDITGLIAELRQEDKPISDLPAYMASNLLLDAKKEFSFLTDQDNLSDCFIKITDETDRKFIFIIDEWDAIIREASDDKAVQKAYLDILRGWFKNNNFTPKVVAAAYMTGILPIKKDGSESAISDFKEYTMIKPRQFSDYVGFTEEEVYRLCNENNCDFEMMKKWYDGYRFSDGTSVYNPNSVMQAIENRDFDSYWTETSTAEGLMEYISKGYDGLSKTIAELIGGVDVCVDTLGFSNDISGFKGKDDVLTLLIHLGYLSYNSETGMVTIPNEEIRREFSRSVRTANHAETLTRLRECDQLFMDTIQGNEEAVAKQIEKVHMEETAPINYNREDSLRSVIKLAYYTYRDNYVQMEELPSGEGYADIVYIPKPESDYPALLIELKWNESAQAAISQIHKNKYPAGLEGFNREIVLVGINYDKDSGAGNHRHTCIIEKINKSGRY